MNDNELHSCSVLVTRPNPQGKELCEKIINAGGKAIFFPTIAIQSLADSEEFRAKIMSLDSFDDVIFISPQAVYQTASVIQRYWLDFPKNTQVSAIGGGTARALQEAKLPVHCCPQERWNSEGLLELPYFQHINSKKIALIRGEGGRAFLAEELLRRGAVLTHIIAYRRHLPNSDTSEYLDLLTKHKIDIIVCTSTEILLNLVQLSGLQAVSILYALPLIVVSEEMAILAKKMGFQLILRASNASHHIIMKTLKDHVCQMKQNKM